MTLYQLCEIYDRFRVTYDVRGKDAITIFNDFTKVCGVTVSPQNLGELTNYIIESQIVPQTIIANGRTSDELLYPDITQQLLQLKEA